MTNWTDIHPDFGEKEYSWINTTLQQNWEQQDLTKQEAQSWLIIGFEPNDYYLASQWKNLNFTPQQTQSWLAVGVKTYDYHFASWLRYKNYSPQSAKNNLKQLKTEFNNLKNEPTSWVQQVYLNQSITKLDLRSKDLQGQLDLTNYTNLQELYLWSNKLTHLKITNCSQIKLNIGDNKLTTLDISNNKKLKELDCSNNHLLNLTFLQTLPNPKNLTNLNMGRNPFPSQTLDFLTPFVNLEKLNLRDTNLTGSLSPLSNLTKLKELSISNTNLNSEIENLPPNLEIIYANNMPETQEKLKGFENEYGKYNYQPWRQIWNEWKKLNFSESEIKQWLNAGTSVNDYEFVKWLKDVKKETPNWVTNYQKDYQILSERFKDYGLCPECEEPNTGTKWCQTCNSNYSQQNFKQWTSNNLQIDKFIQKHQLNATDSTKFLEWIPYEQFRDIEKSKELKTVNSELQFLRLQHDKLKRSTIKRVISRNKLKQINKEITDYASKMEKLTIEAEGGIEHIANGGFGKVYKAKWMMGNIQYWDTKTKQWHREKDEDQNYKEVVLKSINNSQNNTNFLQEVEKHKVIDDWFNNIVPCYGLSQDPKTGDYLMVMQYIPEGNLRQHLSKNNQQLSLLDKLKYLTKIAQGLKDIHQKNLVHCDFHSGNILKGIDKTACLITDLGLCKPINETNQEEKIYGVLPYVAPEVLQNKPYTQASDIYSFGIVAYEVLSELPPYSNQAHDANLALQICQGLRPIFQIKIPQLLQDLIKRCWSADSNQRPSANELEKILRGWEQNIEFTKQLQQAEQHNSSLPNHIKYPSYKLHKNAIYTSTLLPTKQITKLLQNQQLHNVKTQAIELNKDLKKLNNIATEINSIEKKKTELDQVEQQKRNEFQEVLTNLLQKSRDLTGELNKILSSNTFTENEELSLRTIKDLQSKNNKLQTKLSKSQKEDIIYQELLSKKEIKEKDLEELENSIIIDNKIEDIDDLSQIAELLEKQEVLVRSNSEESLKKLETAKRIIIRLRIINQEQVNQLCQKQSELTSIKIQLNQAKHQSEEQLTKAINYITNNNITNITQSIVDVKGNVQIEGNFNPRIDEYQTQTEQPPKYSY